VGSGDVGREGVSVILQLYENTVKNAIGSSQIRREWREIDELPHIHLRVPYSRVFADVRRDYAGALLVVAVHGGSMTYRFSVSEWAEVGQIMDHYIEPLTRKGAM